MTDPLTVWPLWLQDIRTTLAVTPQFVIWGNVHDVHEVPGRGFGDTKTALWALLSDLGYAFMLTFDPADGLSVVPNQQAERDQAQEMLSQLSLAFDEDRGTPTTPSTLTEVMRTLCDHSSTRAALVISRPARLTADVTRPDTDWLAFFTAAERAASRPNSAQPEVQRNPVFWLLDREQDIPHWLVADNEPYVRTVVIATPDRDARVRSATQVLGKSGLARSSQGMDLEALAASFADRTDGMSLVDLSKVVSLAVDQGIPIDDLEAAIRAYRVGASDNPWRKEYLRQRIERAEDAGGIRARVRGQEPAITKALDILKRSVLGLSGAQARSSGKRPRGVMLMVGPTGTGKTELAKALTETVFGPGSEPLRFDMSEFGSEHSDARLLGAPPGYVGYDAGGELTNALRRQPFSLVLFDEIDKAHPRILDKFLQILDEGRLTDGRGATVSFQESILVFTSNAGMEEVNQEVLAKGATADVLPTYADLAARLEKAIDHHFTVTLQRPELLNRFGENIVYFDFIRPPVSEEIVANLLDHVVTRVEEELSITLALTEQVRMTLVRECIGNPVMGGRGIANLVEAQLVNPLARALFDRDPNSGDRLTVTDWSQTEGVATVTVS